MTILKYLFKICLREKGNDVSKREEKALAGGSVMSPLFTALNSSERPKLAWASQEKGLLSSLRMSSFLEEHVSLESDPYGWSQGQKWTPFWYKEKWTRPPQLCLTCPVPRAPAPPALPIWLLNIAPRSSVFPQKKNFTSHHWEGIMDLITSNCQKLSVVYSRISRHFSWPRLMIKKYLDSSLLGDPAAFVPWLQIVGSAVVRCASFQGWPKRIYDFLCTGHSATAVLIHNLL